MVAVIGLDNTTPMCYSWWWNEVYAAESEGRSRLTVPKYPKEFLPRQGRQSCRACCSLCANTRSRWILCKQHRMKGLVSSKLLGEANLFGAGCRPSYVAMKELGRGLRHLNPHSEEAQSHSLPRGVCLDNYSALAPPPRPSTDGTGKRTAGGTAEIGEGAWLIRAKTAREALS